MGVNTSSETLSPGLSEHNSLVVTPDGPLPEECKHQPAGKVILWLSRESKGSHHSHMFLEAYLVRAWTEKVISPQQLMWEVLDSVIA